MIDAGVRVFPISSRGNFRCCSTKTAIQFQPITKLAHHVPVAEEYKIRRHKVIRQLSQDDELLPWMENDQQDATEVSRSKAQKMDRARKYKYSFLSLVSHNLQRQ